MTLTELKYIVAVARERNFGRAAEACYVSQPTLSVAVKKLEEELGVTLFERGKQDIRITRAGEKIVEHARQILDQVDQLRTLATEEQDQLQGPLKLGAIYTIGPYLFPHLVPQMRELAPDMPLVIEENYTSRLTERLREGELDAILIALPFEVPGIVTLPLYDEPFVTLLPSSHPWVDKKQIKPAELANENVLLLGAGNCFRDQVVQLCPECLHSGNQEDALLQTPEGSSLETIRHMVASGIGITVLPCSAAGADRYSQRLVTIRRFTKPVPSRRIALAWRVSFPRPRAIDILRQAIVACELSCVDYLKDR